ncbi:hypothetical protein [Nostoc sp. 'Peltigera malacea cyanobiont' DB3992]
MSRSRGMNAIPEQKLGWITTDATVHEDISQCFYYLEDLPRH